MVVQELVDSFTLEEDIRTAELEVALLEMTLSLPTSLSSHYHRLLHSHHPRTHKYYSKVF